MRFVRGLLRFLLALAFVVLIVGGSLFLALRFVPSVGDPSGRAIGHSLASELESPRLEDGDGRCTTRTEGSRERWTCRIDGGEDGGPRVSYRLRLDERCWNALRVEGGALPGAPVDRRVEGCVELRDQVRLDERLPW